VYSFPLCLYLTRGSFYISVPLFRHDAVYRRIERTCKLVPEIHEIGDVLAVEDQEPHHTAEVFTRPVAVADDFSVSAMAFLDGGLRL
jgi:hypothetical protein